MCQKEVVTGMKPVYELICIYAVGVSPLCVRELLCVRAIVCAIVFCKG